ncbi:MAG: DUF2298 domain-containing protein [Caldilineaceae bacterium]
MPLYDFWGPSRVLPFTINEFPYWSFLFADLHPHLIGIPLALFFLIVVLIVLGEYRHDWRGGWGRSVGLVALLGLLLGTLAAVNLWELPTYFGVGVLALAVSLYRGRGHIPWALLLAFAGLYLFAAVLFFLPFFRSYHSVAAGGVGLVKEGDALGLWLLIWGLFAFVLVSWLFYVASRHLTPAGPGRAGPPTGMERLLSLSLRRYDRLPRVLDLHRKLVRRPSFGYVLGAWLVPLTLAIAVIALFLDRTVLAFCLPFLTLATLLLWRRSAQADPGTLFATLLTATGFAVLAGTQVVYLKDFLQGGEWYRMNTLFKFFSQVWVIWAVAAAVGLPQVWAAVQAGIARSTWGGKLWRVAWSTAAVVLVALSFSYTILGTPARLDQRFMGWRPPFGTLNGLDFMREGVYYWPDEHSPIELRYDWEAIEWLLDHVRGNPVVVESAEVEYYRAGGTRIASLTGLSGLRGMHASEQRYGDEVGQRDGLHREFWRTPDIARTEELIDQLDIALIYVGQLERKVHPEGVDKLAQMAADGLLTVIYENERVTIYAVPGALVQNDEGVYVPS